MTPISAAQQFKAIAYLRWRLLINSWRTKNGKGEFLARLLGIPIALFFLSGIIAGALAAGWGAAHKGHLEYLSAVFWGIFALQILASINISPPALSFDPASLIRFPLSFSRYLLVRLFLGLLSVSTVAGTCALLAAATGVTIVYPALAPLTYSVALALALTNMLFTRMVFAWVDRWLSTRRAREFFTAFIILFSLGIQYVNVTFNDFGGHQTHAQRAAKIGTALRAYHAISPALHALPPGLAALSLARGHAGDSASALLDFAAILLFAAAFLAVFAWRMQREYRGENLSEAPHQPSAQPTPAARLPHAPAAIPASVASAEAGSSLVSPALEALLSKEWTYIRRNPAQYYGLLAPLAMVFLFAARMGRFGATGLLFPAAAAYSMLGVSALAYNVLGMDANGVQFYFLSPVSFHSIFLAKNLFSFSITAIQLILVYLLITFTVGAPRLLLTLSVVTWLAFAALVNVAVGNYRSITAPKKIDPAKVSRRQASQLSALLALAIMLAVIGLGAAVLLGAAATHLPWLPIPIFAVLAGGAFALYWAMLTRVDSLATGHRETLIEELSKVE